MISAKSCCEQVLQRLGAGPREHEVALQRTERRLDRDQVRIVVVDDEDVLAVLENRYIALVVEVSRHVCARGTARDVPGITVI